ncbi:hypothetical protein HNY73_011908 [Argiope bruennichi]|uniref:Uncharacterized protein n=1 Tax=Argiope bruennichi TaxID=94029 RepID=A0A8T0ETV2_ARGBR|nr:hypothetical protein HNY73_011908 [Argiope bruennichi]
MRALVDFFQKSSTRQQMRRGYSNMFKEITKEGNREKFVATFKSTSRLTLISFINCWIFNFQKHILIFYF